MPGSDSKNPAEILLNAFVMASPGHLSAGLWSHPDDQSHRYTDLAYWADLAKTLERGKFDGIFFADVLGIYDVYKGSGDAAYRSAMQVPVNDPLPLISAMALVTEHLGFGLTASVSFEHPYPFARRISSLDHITRGRIGWNVVTSYLESGARNLGHASQLTHDNRYDLADDYLTVCYKLWEQSWDEDAVRRDAEKRVFTDPRKVHEIGHQGPYFNVPGAHLSEPSPQRTPLIYQAGASSRGKSFAAKHAEVAFCASPTRNVLKAYIDDLEAKLAQFGRRREDIRVLNQFTIVVGETDEAAHAKLKDYRRYVDRDGALAMLSGWMGVDLGKYSQDQTFEHTKTNALQSTIEAFSSADPGRKWSIGELAEFVGIGGDTPIVVGSPKTVADALESWVAETGADGFNLGAVINPGTFEDIVDLLVPELQRRGVFKRDYASGSLRGKLFGYGPRVNDRHAAAKVKRAAPDRASEEASRPALTQSA